MNEPHDGRSTDGDDGGGSVAGRSGWGFAAGAVEREDDAVDPDRPGPASDVRSDDAGRLGPEPGARSDGAADPTGATVVNAFPMRDVVLVRHYFEDPEAFEVLEEFYDRRNYRFEVPRSAFDRVRVRLAAHGYRLAPVEDVADFAVVVRKYRDHPEVVFEASVVEFSSDDYNVFVLADEAAVVDAVQGGAVRLRDAPVEVRFPTAHGTGPLTVSDVTADR